METFIRKFNIDTSICDGLIEYHNNNFEYREAGKLADYAHGGPVLDKSYKDSLDVYFFGFMGFFQHGACDGATS